MKKFIQHALMLAGLYFIVSFFIPDSENIWVIIVFFTTLVMFVLSLIILCFKKRFLFIDKFINRFHKISNFIKALGMVEYFELVFVFIPAGIYGYNKAMALYNGEEYTSIIPNFISYMYYTYWGIWVISLLWASYRSFIKKL